MRILTTGIKELDESKFVPCTGTRMNKPEHGCCLWGSAMIHMRTGQVASSWSYFTQFDYTSRDFKYGISYTLKKSARILEIDTIGDYLEVLEKYGFTDRFSEARSINFVEVSKDYDAFHLTENAAFSMRFIFFETEEFGKIADFYSYDAESWVLFNLDCINKGSILNHNNVHWLCCD